MKHKRTILGTPYMYTFLFNWGILGCVMVYGYDGLSGYGWLMLGLLLLLLNFFHFALLLWFMDLLGMWEFEKASSWEVKALIVVNLLGASSALLISSSLGINRLFVGFVLLTTWGMVVKSGIRRVRS